VEITLLTNLLGAVGLGAASGLNAWIPLLALGVAERTGLVTLSAPFNELGSTPVLAVLAVVFVIDLIGDKVPAVDHVLHAVGALVAPASGAVVVMAQENLLTEVHPAVAAILGLVLGGSIHAGRSALRPVVTAGTGGVGNPVVSIVEDVSSVMLTVLAIVVPVLAFLSVVGMVVLGIVLYRRWRRRRAERRQAEQVGPGVAPGVAAPPDAWQRYR
jgi:hypothetical protein